MDVRQVSQVAIQKNTWMPSRTKVIIAIAFLVLALSGWGLYRIFRTKPVDRTFEKVPAQFNSVKTHKETVILFSDIIDSFYKDQTPVSIDFCSGLNTKTMDDKSIPIRSADLYLQKAGKPQDRAMALYHKDKGFVGQNIQSIRFKYLTAGGKKISGILYDRGSKNKAETLKFDRNRLEYIRIYITQINGEVTRYKFNET